MSRTVWVVRAPESENRPERFIADEILTQLECYGTKIAVIDPNPVNGEDPLSGKMFYDNQTFKKNFLSAAKQITQKVKGGDAILFIEGFNPLVQFLNYWFFVENKVVDMYGVFHSSTRTPGDLFFGNEMMQRMEREIVQSYKTVFVATDYLANHLRQIDGVIDVEQVGLPIPRKLERPALIPTRLPKTIMWSHRWAEDKNCQVYLALSGRLPDYKFLILSPNKLSDLPEQDQQDIYSRQNIEWRQCKDKSAYHSQLQMNGGIFFSSATLETFGYSFLEAVSHGWYPLVPDFASYSEMTRPRNKYSFDPARLDSPMYLNNLTRSLARRIQRISERNNNEEVLSANFMDKYGHSGNRIAATLGVVNG